MRLLFCASLVLLATPARAATQHVYALIVAENRGPDDSVRPLRFADDDGVRYYELFNAYADHAELLAVLDEDTQRQHRDVAQDAGVPTIANLHAAFDRINQAMRADLDAGGTSIFYLVYTGHGGVSGDGEGFVTLRDGKLTRTEMYDGIVGQSVATYNHLIIDACDSYFFVNARGSDWVSDRRGAPRAAAVDAYVTAHSLERYPNTGVLLSTAKATESHEWSRYGAGVFSHEVRSGLIGTADVNGDGRIEYSEIAAYVAAANLSVDDPRARLEIYARPPAVYRAQPLFDLRQMRTGSLLQFDARDSGHYEIEDDRGVRYADFNKAAAYGVAVVLLPDHGYFVRRGDSEAFVPRSAHATIAIGSANWRPTSLAARDATSDIYAANLYAVPYGPSFYQGFVATSGDEPVRAVADGDAFPVGNTTATMRFEQPPASLKPWAITATAVSGAAATAAIITYLMRSQTVTTTDTTIGNPIFNGNGRKTTADSTTPTTTQTVTRGSMLPTYVLAGTAVAAGVTAAVLWIMNSEHPNVNPTLTVPITVAPTLGGGMVVGTFGF